MKTSYSLLFNFDDGECFIDLKSSGPAFGPNEEREYTLTSNLRAFGSGASYDATIDGLKAMILGLAGTGFDLEEPRMVSAISRSLSAIVTESQRQIVQTQIFSDSCVQAENHLLKDVPSGRGFWGTLKVYVILMISILAVTMPVCMIWGEKSCIYTSLALGVIAGICLAIKDMRDERRR